MPSRRSYQSRRSKQPSSSHNKSTSASLAPRPRRSTKLRFTVPLSRLSRRSSEARTKALHVLAAMRREPGLRLYPTAHSFGVKPSVVKKHFGSALNKIDGRFRVIKSDRFPEMMYVPDEQGRPIPVLTENFKERGQVSA